MWQTFLSLEQKKGSTRTKGLYRLQRRKSLIIFFIDLFILATLVSRTVEDAASMTDSPDASLEDLKKKRRSDLKVAIDVRRNWGQTFGLSMLHNLEMRPSFFVLFFYSCEHPSVRITVYLWGGCEFPERTRSGQTLWDLSCVWSGPAPHRKSAHSVVFFNLIRSIHNALDETLEEHVCVPLPVSVSVFVLYLCACACETWLLHPSSVSQHPWTEQLVSAPNVSSVLCI